MSFWQILVINFKKLFFYKSKALFLVIPMAILVALGLIIVSETSNIRSAAQGMIVGTVEEQNRVLELSKNPMANLPGGTSTSGGAVRMVSFNADPTQNGYNQKDQDAVSAIAGVQKASILQALNVNQMASSDLFAGKKVSLMSFQGLDSAFASKYTSSDFSYQDGQPIPVILNASGFIEEYEQWNGKQDMEMTFPKAAAINAGSTAASGMVTSGTSATINANGSDGANPFPNQQRAVNFDKNTLIGKVFTVDIGGLQAGQDFSTTPTETGLKFHKYTTEELAATDKKQSDAIAPYWDYAKIKAPISYKFKVVGIVEDGAMSYVPPAALNKIQHDYYQHQIDARTTKAIDKALLGSTFLGQNYDGVSFKQDIFSMMGGGATLSTGMMGSAVAVSSTTTAVAVGGASLGGPPGALTSYTIPGLIISVKRTDSSVQGEIKDLSFLSTVPVIGDTMEIKINSIYDRPAVVEAMNQAGYGFQDNSKTNIFRDLQRNLSLATWGFSLAFVVLSIILIGFVMSKFVSEGKREIGVYRALGMSKDKIRALFFWQALVLTVIGYGVGVLVGIVSIKLISAPMHTWFVDVLGKSIKDAFNVVNPVSNSQFSLIDFATFKIHSVILLVITLVIALIPADTAANTSPIEAMRGE